MGKIKSSRGRGQEAGEDIGKYVVLWKKTPEGWKIHWARAQVLKNDVYGALGKIR